MIRRKIKKDPAIFRILYKSCRTFEPEIIHSWGTMASVYAFPMAQMLGIKFVNGMITTAVCKTFSKRWWRSRVSFPFSDKILANSRAGLEVFKAPPGKSQVIHNGFDFNRLNNLIPPDEIRKKFGIITSRVVGMVATVDFRKDYPTFVRAARRVIKALGDVTFLCVGAGPDLEKMKEATADCPEILFTGRQNNIESILQIFDVAVLTTNSAKCHEGVSNSLVEYMASGLPVIATTGGGTNEVIEDGISGYLIPAFADELLAEKITALLQNDEQRLELGRQARQRIADAFSFQKMINSLDQVYKGLVYSRNAV
jgi:glycosyltransferase involved in cell wall biosynthesis